jgi:hypothetical protein
MLPEGLLLAPGTNTKLEVKEKKKNVTPQSGKNNSSSTQTEVCSVFFIFYYF